MSRYRRVFFVGAPAVGGFVAGLAVLVLSFALSRCAALVAATCDWAPRGVSVEVSARLRRMASYTLTRWNEEKAHEAR